MYTPSPSVPRGGRVSAGTGPIDELGPPVHRLGDLSYDTPGGSNNVTFTSELAAAAGPSFTPRMVGGTQAPPSSLNRSIHAPESRSAGVPVPSAYEQFDELGWIVDLSSRIRAALVGGTAEAASTSSSPTERRRTARVSRPSQDFLELEREIKRRKLAALNASQLRDEDVFGVSAEVGGEELDSIHSSGKGKGKSKAEGLSAEEWAKQAQRDFEARKAAEVAGAAALAEASRTSVAVQTSPPTLRPQNLPNSFMNGFMLPSSQAAAAAADAGPIAGGEDPAATRAALAARAVQEMLAGGGVDTEDGEEAIDLSELFASTGSATGLTGLSQGGQQTPSALFSALGTREGEGEPFDFEQILRARAGLVGLGAQDEEEEEEDGEEEEEGDHEMEDIANRQGAGPTRKALIEEITAPSEDASGSSEEDSDEEEEREEQDSEEQSEGAEWDEDGFSASPEPETVFRPSAVSVSEPIVLSDSDDEDKEKDEISSPAMPAQKHGHGPVSSSRVNSALADEEEEEEEEEEDGDKLAGEAEAEGDWDDEGDGIWDEDEDAELDYADDDGLDWDADRDADADPDDEHPEHKQALEQEQWKESIEELGGFRNARLALDQQLGRGLEEEEEEEEEEVEIVELGDSSVEDANMDGGEEEDLSKPLAAALTSSVPTNASALPGSSLQGVASSPFHQTDYPQSHAEQQPTPGPDMVTDPESATEAETHIDPQLLNAMVQSVHQAAEETDARLEQFGHEQQDEQAAKRYVGLSSSDVAPFEAGVSDNSNPGLGAREVGHLEPSVSLEHAGLSLPSSAPASQGMAAQDNANTWREGLYLTTEGPGTQEMQAMQAVPTTVGTAIGDMGDAAPRTVGETDLELPEGLPDGQPGTITSSSTPAEMLMLPLHTSDVAPDLNLISALDDTQPKGLSFSSVVSASNSPSASASAANGSPAISATSLPPTSNASNAGSITPFNDFPIIDPDILTPLPQIAPTPEALSRLRSATGALDAPVGSVVSNASSEEDDADADADADAETSVPAQLLPTPTVEALAALRDATGALASYADSVASDVGSDGYQAQMRAPHDQHQQQNQLDQLGQSTLRDLDDASVSGSLSTLPEDGDGGMGRLEERAGMELADPEQEQEQEEEQEHEQELPSGLPEATDSKQAALGEPSSPALHAQDATSATPVVSTVEPALANAVTDEDELDEGAHAAMSVSIAPEDVAPLAGAETISMDTSAPGHLAEQNLELSMGVSEWLATGHVPEDEEVVQIDEAGGEASPAPQLGEDAINSRSPSSAVRNPSNGQEPRAGRDEEGQMLPDVDGGEPVVGHHPALDGAPMRTADVDDGIEESAQEVQEVEEAAQGEATETKDPSEREEERMEIVEERVSGEEVTPLAQGEPSITNEAAHHENTIAEHEFLQDETVDVSNADSAVEPTTGTAGAPSASLELPKPRSPRKRRGSAARRSISPSLPPRRSSRHAAKAEEPPTEPIALAGPSSLRSRRKTKGETQSDDESKAPPQSLTTSPRGRRRKLSEVGEGSSLAAELPRRTSTRRGRRSSQAQSVSPSPLSREGSLHPEEPAVAGDEAESDPRSGKRRRSRSGRAQNKLLTAPAAPAAAVIEPSYGGYGESTPQRAAMVRLEHITTPGSLMSPSIHRHHHHHHAARLAGLALPDVVVDTPQRSAASRTRLVMSQETVKQEDEDEHGQKHEHGQEEAEGEGTGEVEAEDEAEMSGGPATRSQCRFHRIKLLRHPSAPTFIVPGCAIAHDKLKEEGAQYCGEASEAENERKVNFDAEDLLAEEHHSLSRIVGLNMLPDVCILPEAKLAIEQAEGRGMMVKEEDVETFDDTQAKTQAAVDEEDETHVDEVLPEVVISPGIPRHQAGEEDDVFSSAVAKERGSRATSEASSGGQSGGKQARQRRKSRKSDPRGDNADFKPAPGDSDEDEESSARRAKRGRKSAASKAEEHAEADLGGRQNGEDAASDLGEALTSFEEGRLGTGEGAEDGEGIAEALTRAGSNLEDAVGGAANLSAPSSPKAKRRSRRSRTSDPTFKPIKAEEVSDEDEKDGLTSAPARRKSRGGRKSLSVQVPAEELRSLADAVEGTPEQQAVENGSEDGAGTAASASASASSSAGKRKRGRKSDPGAANAAFKPEPTASDESDGEDTVGDKRALRKRKTENGAAPVRGSDADEQGARDDNAREEAMGAQTPSKSGGLLGRLKFW